MGELYRDQWIRAEGQTPSKIWKDALSTMSDGDVLKALAGCFERVKAGNPYCPTFAEFIAMANEIDTDDAYDRMLRKNPPKSLAEKRTRADCSYNCRRLAEDKSRALFKKTYEKYCKLEANGELKARPMMLTEHVATKVSDTERDNYEPSTVAGAKLMDRLNKIRSGRVINNGK